MSKVWKFTKVILISGALAFFLIEVGFRVVRRAGGLGLDYGDVFSQQVMNEGGFLIPDQQVELTNGYGEKVPWVSNSKGFRNDREFAYDRPGNVIRILSIGDSFAAGYRVGQNETYSAILEQQLNAHQDSVRYEVMVACTLNPLQGLEYLNKYGLKYKPDIVLLGITLGNDVSEIYLRLHEYGNNRLEGTDVFENAAFDKPKLEAQVMTEQLPPDAYYAASELNDYFDRLITPKLLSPLLFSSYKGESIYAIKGKVPPYVHDFTHGLGIYLKDRPESIDRGFEGLEKLLVAHRHLAETHQYDLRVGLFPQRFQVNGLDQRETIKDYHLNSDAFDWEAPNKAIRQYCDVLALHCIDPLEEFKKQDQNLYLPGGDMHWNARGQRVMAKAFLAEIWGIDKTD